MLPRGMLPDVAAALGADLADVDLAVIARAVDDQLPEFEQLDWKRLYPTNQHGRAEVAKDVAALANARGGVVVVGVDEEDGRAYELRPIAVGDEEERRIVQTVATGTHPRVDVRVVSIRDSEDPTRGVLVIVVPPSPVAPHAVEDDDRLRYPVRRGTTTSALREHEVREAYLRQRERATDRRDQATNFVSQSLSVVDNREPVRIVVAIVPDRPGALDMTEALVRELQGQPLPDPTMLHEGGSWSHGRSQAVLGGVRLTWGSNQSAAPPDRFVQYVDDGSIAYGTSLGFPPPTESDAHRQLYTADERPMVPQQMAVGHVTRAVEVAGEHAQRCGTFGTATAVAYMIGPSSRPLVTFRTRGDFVGATSNVSNPAPDALATTIELPTSGDGAALVMSARRAVQPLMQLHGVADVPILNEDGTVSAYGRSEAAQVLRLWAGRVGTEVR